MTDLLPAPDQPGHAPSSGTASAWRAFGAWAVVGTGLSLSLLSVLSIGVFVLAATVLVSLVVIRWRHSFAETFGVVSGLALPLFYVAYLNRDAARSAPPPPAAPAAPTNGTPGHG
jgi:hypothetical protein